MENDMSNVLVLYYCDHFRLFIEKVGGWDDLAEFNKVVKRRQRQELNPYPFRCSEIIAALLYLYLYLFN